MSNMNGAFVNPLDFMELELQGGSLRDSNITYEEVVKYTCAPQVSHKMEDLVERYNHVSSSEPRLFVAPADEAILGRLVWPLRYAKGSFMVGNFLGSIALCGLVAEMAAIFIFEVDSKGERHVPQDPKGQKQLFGSSFEKLGQMRRVEVLSAYGLIDDTIKFEFDNIRNLRRSYLHHWSENHDDIESDAVACFCSAAKIVVQTFGFKVNEGKLLIRQPVHDYLVSKGVIEE